MGTISTKLLHASGGIEKRHAVLPGVRSDLNKREDRGTVELEASPDASKAAQRPLGQGEKQ